MRSATWRFSRTTAAVWAVVLACLLGPLPVQGQTDKDIADQWGLSEEIVARLHTGRGLNNKELSSFPAKRLPRLVKRLDYPNLQQLRLDFRILQHEDELGAIAPNAMPRAAAQFKRLQLETARGAKAGVPVGPPDLSKLLPLAAEGEGAGWSWLGPGNIGGRTRALLVDPTNPQVMWAGSVGGGIWTTTDGGKQWRPVNDFLANLVVSCLVMDPRRPDVLYAGTGEGFYNADAMRGGGIFRSADRGATWAPIPSTTIPDFLYVNRIAISPDGMVMLAATPAGLFRSTDEGNSWSERITEQVADIDFHPTDPQRAIAGSLSKGCAWWSDDGGVTWYRANGIQSSDGRVEVAYALKEPSIVYGSVEENFGRLYASTDGGRTFSPRNTGNNYLARQGWYNNSLWAGDPTNADVVIVGGINLWRSTDGGATLTPITKWYIEKSVHADHHVIVPHPGYNGTSNTMVFLGNDGGIYKTEDLFTAGQDSDCTAGWEPLNNNYGVAQFYGAAGNVETGTIIAGAQDNGTLRYTPGRGPQGWTRMDGGDGGWCAADPRDPRCLYGEYVFLQISRSDNGGDDAQFICGQYWNGDEWKWKPEPYCIPDARQRKANFIAPFVLDPHDANRLLGGGLSLWRTNDSKSPNTTTAGPKWAEIKSPIGSEVRKHAISTIAIAPQRPDLIWVGHNDGSLFKTDNGTAERPAWSRVGQGAGLPRRYCHWIAIDPRDPQRVYATFGGYHAGNVWKTTDGGATWQNIAPSLPAAPVRCLAFHPDLSNYLYLGTEVGLFASDDGGVTWSPTNEGPANCSVEQLFWMRNNLIAVTHGRGLFSIALRTFARRPLTE